jgi:hypothetical protein
MIDKDTLLHFATRLRQDLTIPKKIGIVKSPASAKFGSSLAIVLMKLLQK